MNTKEYLFMRDIITQYHPEFKSSQDLQAFGLKYPGHFNIEFLIEECLAAIGGYKFVDAEGYDFCDYSDSKTTTVNANTGVVTISSVETKIGALRITAFNPIKNGIDYFYVPKRDLNRVRMACYGKSEHKQRILFTYSRKNHDDYGWFEDYRVNSFTELATMRG